MSSNDSNSFAPKSSSYPAFVRGALQSQPFEPYDVNRPSQETFVLTRMTDDSQYNEALISLQSSHHVSQQPTLKIFMLIKC